jgi:putative oxidoreductase
MRVANKYIIHLLFKSNIMNYPRIATRLLAGLMFFALGLSKLANPEGFAGALDSMGFPISLTLAWVVLVVEIIGGAMLTVGFKSEYASVPLVAILAVATLVTHMGIPAPLTDILASFVDGSTVFMHLLGIAVLSDFAVNGAGEFSVEG